jgi:putative phage-type endonuclease
MLTEKQLLERQKFIGSSDIGALFGLDPFRSPADVFVSKVYELEKDEAYTPSKSIGNRYESVLLDYASDKLGREVIRTDTRFICEKHPIFACNLDGYILTKEQTWEIVEAKTTGMADEWGDEGTDEVPDRVLLQVQHQLLCTGWQVAHVVVLLGKFGLAERMYRVERNEDLIQAIIDKGEDFWNNNVLAKIPPSGEIKKPDIVK